MPATHGLQVANAKRRLPGVAVAPDTSDHVPAAQFAHSELPSLLVYWPATHNRHDAADVAPIIVELVPAAQLVHAAAPLDDHDPALHVEHDEAILDDHVPALHVVQDVDPTVLNVPAVHDPIHTVAASTVE